MFDWEDVIVKTKSGCLRGALKLGNESPQYYAFKGIPYAEPPVGELRFQDPVPVEKWSGIKEALEFGSMCWQHDTMTRNLTGSEDCLYLNVYTRSVENFEELKPVMFFIHGGGFTFGSGSDTHYGPEYLLRKDVVLVTLNYRLGVFGFLNLEHEIAPGNQGLKDLVVALKWVQDNIENFGGDPNNVTIFGESSGAVCVHYLILSPLAKGLFHKAICQSGVAFNCWARIKNPKPYVYQLCKLLGKDLKEPKEIFEFLKTIQGRKLLEAQEMIRKSINIVTTSFPFCPGIDNKSPNPFMPIAVEEAAKNGVHIPFLLGYNNREGIGLMISFNKDIFDIADKNLEKMMNPRAEEVFIQNYNLNLSDLRYMYLKNDRISYKNADIYIDMLADINIIDGYHRGIKTQIEKSSSSTYFYKFSYADDISLTKTLLKLPFSGACHFDEIEYLFYIHIRTMLGLAPIKKGTQAYRIMEQMTEMWTNFARYGSPVPTTSDVLPVEWLPVDDAETLRYLNIDKKLQMESTPNIERHFMNFKSNNVSE